MLQHAEFWKGSGSRLARLRRVFSIEFKIGHKFFGMVNHARKCGLAMCAWIAVFDDFECSVFVDVTVREDVCNQKVAWRLAGFGTVNDTGALSTGGRLVWQSRAGK